MLAYCASKAGVNALLEGLRVEVQPCGVAVTTICPGWIRTPMTAPIQGKLDYLMDVEEAAREIVSAIKRKRFMHVFPRKMRWRMRLLGCLPLAWQDRMLRKMLARMRTNA
jgi:short-subunit dehydrogenase